MSESKRWQPSGFADRLRVLRESAGLTQAELAERAGCFPLTVSKLERGVQEPAWPLVLALANALNVPCDAFRADSSQGVAEGRPGNTVGLTGRSSSDVKAPEKARSRGRPRKAGTTDREEAAGGRGKRGSRAKGSKD